MLRIEVASYSRNSEMTDREVAGYSLRVDDSGDGEKGPQKE